MIHFRQPGLSNIPPLIRRSNSKFRKVKKTFIDRLTLKIRSVFQARISPSIRGTFLNCRSISKRFTKLTYLLGNKKFQSRKLSYYFHSVEYLKHFVGRLGLFCAS